MFPGFCNICGMERTSCECKVIERTNLTRERIIARIEAERMRRRAATPWLGLENYMAHIMRKLRKKARRNHDDSKPYPVHAVYYTKGFALELLDGAFVLSMGQWTRNREYGLWECDNLQYVGYVEKFGDEIHVSTAGAYDEPSRIARRMFKAMRFVLENNMLKED